MASSKPVVITYEAESTPQLFHNSPAFVRAIMGPIGSGKSVACIQEAVRIGIEQKPQSDGIRRTRWAFIRNTYPELKSTTIQTFLEWFGPVSTIKYDTPIEAIIRFGDVWIQIYFLAMDQEKDVKKLKSLDLTGVWINEAGEVLKSVLDMATGRVNRYPSKTKGGITRSCVLLDTNPPDDDHWWYELFEEDCPETYEVFKQPPALLKLKGKSGPIYVPNPDAENIKNHSAGYDYYLQQIPGKREQWIDVFIRGMYGSSHGGRPCYPNYNDQVHCSKVPLEPIKTLPLLLGWDYGRTPACIIAQMMPTGQLRLLDEIVVKVDGPGMGIRKFTRDVVKPYLSTNYQGFESYLSWGDPAGASKGNEETNCYDVQAEEGIPTESALSNEIKYRLDNIDFYLMRMVGGEPGFLMDPKCRIVRKGFLGGYQFERVQVSGGSADGPRYKDQPKKNRYSHPHDAAQYVADLAKNGMVKPTMRVQAAQVQTGINPAGWT